MNRYRLTFSLSPILLLISCSGGGQLRYTTGATLSFSNTDFGARSFGTVSNQTVTVSNGGAATATGIASFSPAAPFGFVGGSFPGTGGTCSDSIGAGATCTLVLNYSAPSPPVVDQSQAVLLVYNNGIGKTSQTIDLKAQANNGSFNRARGFSSNVFALASTSSGVLVGGSFEAFGNQPAVRFARFGSDSALDTTFNAGAGAFAGFNGVVRAIAPALDGSGDFYVGGDFTAYNGTLGVNGIVRLNSDGSRDAAFATGVGFDNSVFAIAPASDGSGDVYCGGIFASYGGSGGVNRIVRLNSDGTMDAAFNTGAGFDNAVFSIVVANDASGDVLVGGAFTSYAGTLGINRLTRLDSNGSRDVGFMAGTGISGSVVRSIAMAANGNLYVGGVFTSYDGNLGLNNLVRLNSSGVFDPLFSIGSGFNSDVLSILLATDGSEDIYVGGFFTSYSGSPDVNRLVRLNSDGSIDPGFSTGTGPTAGFNFLVNSLALALDGSGDVFVGGSFTRYQTNQTVRHFTRLNSDGSVDEGAAASLASSPAFSALNVEAISPALDGSAKVYVGGNFTSYEGAININRIARLNSDGTLDAGFVTGSGASPGFSGGAVLSIAPASNSGGDIWVGGNFLSFDGVGAARIVRLNSDGSVDTDFVYGAGFDAEVTTIVEAVDGSGDIYVGGRFTNYQGAGGASRIVRLNSDGTRDAAFATLAGFDDAVVCLAPAQDGSGDVYVGGDFLNYQSALGVNRIVRLNSDGSLDTGFATGAGFNGQLSACAVAVDGSGDLYVGGAFSSYKGTPNTSRIARLNSDGTLDTTFAIGTGFNTTVTSMALATDGSGQILVGGNFSTYNGSSNLGRIAQLNSDGSLDANFSSGSGYSVGFNITVQCLARAVDGSTDTYVGGLFNSYSGGVLGAIARVSSTGSSD